jgi:hypothetical protein
MTTLTKPDLTVNLHELYETDVYTWAMRNAALIRQGRFAEVDLENVAEEIESVGRSEYRELESRLAVLLTHLLKWQYQPERRSRSWGYTIEEQRDQVRRVLGQNPSLMPKLDEIFGHAYRSARRQAAKETDREKKQFPEGCRYSPQEALNDDFWPD